MNNIIFFDSEEHRTLLPLTYTKAVSELRVGILKIHEKWENALGLSSSNYTQPHLSKLFEMDLTDNNLFILGGLLPNPGLVSSIKNMAFDTILTKNGRILASKGSSLHALKHSDNSTEYAEDITLIKRPWDIFTHNGAEIENDISLLELSPSNRPELKSIIIGDSSKLFIHATAKVYASSLNTTNGPIYIGPNTEVMEGTLIRGPFALCDHGTLKMGAKIYGGTTVGPHSKVGGEVGNSVIQGYSNKGHDGYLGNSVIGEWCNLGADTNSSNLKNNYSHIKIWDYVTEKASDTKLTFCGLIMGDHSKTGINTMLNTGTLVGIGSNVYGAHFPPKFIPSFSWGSGLDFMEHNFAKFCSTAERVMGRRGIKLTEDSKEALQWVFEASSKYRS